jgi:hypothetical protein
MVVRRVSGLARVYFSCGPNQKRNTGRHVDEMIEKIDEIIPIKDKAINLQ